MVFKVIWSNSNIHDDKNGNNFNNVTSEIIYLMFAEMSNSDIVVCIQFLSVIVSYTIV